MVQAGIYGAGPPRNASSILFLTGHNLFFLPNPASQLSRFLCEVLRGSPARAGGGHSPAGTFPQRFARLCGCAQEQCPRGTAPGPRRTQPACLPELSGQAPRLGSGLWRSEVKGEMEGSFPRGILGQQQARDSDAQSASGDCPPRRRPSTRKIDRAWSRRKEDAAEGQRGATKQPTQGSESSGAQESAFHSLPEDAGSPDLPETLLR